MSIETTEMANNIAEEVAPIIPKMNWGKKLIMERPMAGMVVGGLLTTGASIIFAAIVEAGVEYIKKTITTHNEERRAKEAKIVDGKDKTVIKPV